MCIVKHHHQPACNHSWLTISRTCSRGTGFTTCPTLIDGGYHVHDAIQLKPRIVRDSDYCPQCEGEVYDLNEKRMIRRVRKGVKVGGRGAGRGMGGFEVGCGLM